MNSSSKLSISFFGGVGSVTGANFLLSGPDQNNVVRKIGFDCGIEQGTAESHDFNRSAFPYDPKSMDILFITHAHMDHIGRIPKLVREGFNGIIYSTPETYELAVYMLADALKLTLGEAEKKKEVPMYEEVDVKKAFSLWKKLPYHENLEVFPGFSVFGKDAGHVLGSTMWVVTYSGPGIDKSKGESRKVVFTGDLGNTPSPLLKDTEYITDADYMVMESVYGDKNHEGREERIEKLKEVILDVERTKGILLIPAFSLEKTQELLYIFNDFFENKHVPGVPTYLDSPLAINLTHVYEKMSKDFNSEAATRALKDDIFSFPKMRIVNDSQESRELQFAPTPKVIIAGSGMSSGGRIQHHELNHLNNPNTTLLLLGFQALGTLGRQLQEGMKEVEILGQRVEVKAKIVTINGFSSHKDSDHLVEFVSHSVPQMKKVFVAMGETKSSMFLAQRLRDYVGVNALVPKPNENIELE